MTVGLLGKKIGMTQVFDEQGKALAVTVLEVGPCHVTRIRTKEKDGYEAVQLAFGIKKKTRTSKSAQGQFKILGDKLPQYVKEIRTPILQGIEIGKTIGVGLFKMKDKVGISGITVGQGFQGVVKRHKFSGGPGAHGSKFGRESGSIGQHTFRGRVFKGLRMAGHMGHCRITQQNIEVIEVIPDQNLLVVKGSVPGPENALEPLAHLAEKFLVLTRPMMKERLRLGLQHVRRDGRGTGGQQKHGVLGHGWTGTLPAIISASAR